MTWGLLIIIFRIYNHSDDNLRHAVKDLTCNFLTHVQLSHSYSNIIFTILLTMQGEHNSGGTMLQAGRWQVLSLIRLIKYFKFV
jgi:hypothetical protein